MKIPKSLISSAKRVRGLSARNTAIFILCIMILVFSMVIIFSPDNTVASPNFIGVFKIKSNYSEKYLQIDNASFDNSAQVKLFSSNGVDIHQMFAIEDLGDGYVKIINVNSLKVLDLYGNNDKKNEIVIQYNDKGSYNQQFEMQEQDGGFYKVKVRHSGQYLTIKDDNKNEGAVLVQYPFKTSGVNNRTGLLKRLSLLRL